MSWQNALEFAQKQRAIIQPNPGFLEKLKQFKSSEVREILDQKKGIKEIYERVKVLN